MDQTWQPERIEVVGSVNAEAPFSEATIRGLLDREAPAPLGRGEFFVGRPGTGVVCQDGLVAKTRLDLNLDWPTARRWTEHALSAERSLGLHHPRKTWFLARVEGTNRIGNVAPLLDPLHQALPQQTGEEQRRLLERLLSTYLDAATAMGKRLDEGLSNFGLDGEGRLFYLDDDTYEWDNFLSLAEALGHWLRLPLALGPEGFRSLFNSPDVRSMLDADGLPYWRRVLKYCLEHDLQAVLDEYIHTLRESLGLMNAPEEVMVAEIASVIRGVLSIRTSSLDLDEFRLVDGRVALARETKIRCRYALRFADLKDDSDAVLQRASSVRDAFNSPFRPFILATTSVGQEGLDFHTYCHRVWHWNLPRNPVDMEQREGRVNRYKGHAVRKNVARAVGHESLRTKWPRVKDPWDCLFSEARREIDRQASGTSEIKPYWIFEEVEDPSHVERLVPLPPFSSEHARYRALKRSLAVYRLAFGQPRQEDLVTYLAQSDDEARDQLLREMQLDLSA